MSDEPGKIQLLGVAEIKGEKVFVLRFIQGRNPKWVDMPFFAAYDPKATWFSELRPAFGKDYFFFEHEFPTRPMYGDGFYLNNFKPVCILSV